ncbi:MAG: restriction endonuclease subunit S [Algoriphagus sp.]|uniref:restriction endonuclease subunit S n=1 Tax=Algoriphagus sp. TaxID=1872435 RepID=UPI00272FD213|nr:restriction endonuclease subunit S [Algoriphagus sp.]MDP2042872.1 restriction endonuclease subunit S [Algoriphagus sp.]MDP3470929.1 restriction endonuclease subunit S [Algoriphagus sp.]
MKLLEHFKELTLHPKNAQELKGLILQLAVQGKLTRKWREENPDVEPASVLLKKLEVKKKKLIQDKQIRKEQPLEPIYEEDVISSIPPSWELVRLGEIGDWGAGATPSRSRSDYYGGNINWFKSGELNNGIIDYNSEETINELALKNSSLRLNKIGDVLIAMYGATIGKTAILAVEGTTNQAICACTPFACISNVYLHLLLKALKGKFIDQGEGGAQPNISRVKIRNQVFGLPPLEEQKAIVEVVNQLFAEIEQLEALTKERIQLKSDFVTSALNQITQAGEQDTSTQWAFLQQHFGTFFTEKENIKKLREGILQLAVQGKLTHHWRSTTRLSGVEVEPASILLAKIKAEKEQLIKAGKIKKEKPLTEISEDKIPYELPEEWVWSDIESVCNKVTDGFHHTPLKLESGFKYISATHVKEDGILWNECLFIGEKEHSELYKKAKPSKGDILIVNRGAGCGTPAMVDIDEPFSFQNAALIGFNQSLIDPLFMNFYVLQKRSEIMENFTNGGAQPMLSNKILKTLMFPFPPIAEQQAIVEKVNGLFALCDQLDQEIETHQNTQEHWMESCLREVV